MMARVTIEDCLKKITNRFKLIKVAAQRARRLTEFAEVPHVPPKNDRDTVIALREIAAGHIAFDIDEDPMLHAASTVDKVTETPEETATPEATPEAAAPEEAALEAPEVTPEAAAPEEAALEAPEVTPEAAAPEEAALEAPEVTPEAAAPEEAALEAPEVTPEAADKDDQTTE